MEKALVAYAKLFSGFNVVGAQALEVLLPGLELLWRPPNLYLDKAALTGLEVLYVHWD